MIVCWGLRARRSVFRAQGQGSSVPFSRPTLRGQMMHLTNEKITIFRKFSRTFISSALQVLIALVQMTFLCLLYASNQAIALSQLFSNYSASYVSIWGLCCQIETAHCRDAGSRGGFLQGATRKHAHGDGDRARAHTHTHLQSRHGWSPVTHQQVSPAKRTS